MRPCRPLRLRWGRISGLGFGGDPGAQARKIWVRPREGLEPLAGGARNCVPDMVVVSAWKPGLGLLETGAAGTTSAL